ncbi:phosphotransferase family protein [Streptomyces johnsoniae]|uniref:Aminoglycoside phosphotransferase family protein n=1 Tax=Streptomyces johnsoniae TaxID=3075532 RepID=A0ABU2S9U7_9ACTN|nr:aminoglycoside phosphotransferase family protein [Streptomyces sp. DSM 41886]MDT0445702.1 aminoglycoside phosphotransferase family protein [Streptomyces sp. DSM 41886]
MTSVPWSTHAVELRSDSVIKRFRRECRGKCEREWRALTLLAAYAPGLAPVPQRADLAAEEPVVVMSRVPGEPMRGEPLDDQRLKALAAAASELYGAVPAEVLAEIPVRPGQQHQLVAQIRAWAPQARPRVSDEVGEAMDRGLDWLARSGMERASQSDVPMVFGPGDGNLANYLWDGTRVRIVDFEDSGLSDRPFELAEITEHVASWVGPPLDVEAFLDLFDLAAAERVRLTECRRLLALVWLFLLSFDDPQHPRNRPGTAERQAARLSALLTNARH